MAATSGELFFFISRIGTNHIGGGYLVFQQQFFTPTSLHCVELYFMH